MTVQPIRQGDRGSRLDTIIKSTAAGAATGYALKWLWPITKQEDTISNDTIRNYCYKVTNKAKVAEFNKLENKSLAQDTFIKMIKSGDKEAFLPEKLAERVKSIGGESSEAGKEFRAIIRTVDEAGDELIRRFKISKDFMLRYIRPAVPFLVAGAGVGFFLGFTHNVMKSDYYA